MYLILILSPFSPPPIDFPKTLLLMYLILTLSPFFPTPTDFPSHCVKHYSQCHGSGYFDVKRREANMIYEYSFSDHTLCVNDVVIGSESKQDL